MDNFCHETQYWHLLDDGRVQCDLCPRRCKLKIGQRGLCFVRQNSDNKVILTSFGRSSGFCIDPIEKKPLNHFYPGTPVLSFGTAGCNLACKFCQNWDISKSREVDKLASKASPRKIAEAASRYGCRSVAFTYNDPVIFHEYAIEVAHACAEKDIASVAVTAGYICEEPRSEFFKVMDAANIDLKAFNETFYYKLTGAHLQPVLDTLIFLKNETKVWFEITNLLIPGYNDSVKEIEAMSIWIMENLGPDIPLHFTAFHPDWKMQDTPATPTQTLLNAKQLAENIGLHYVYVGNVYDKANQSTYCHVCRHRIIGRDWYQLSDWKVSVQGTCLYCGTLLAGHFSSEPGDWGQRRLPISMAPTSIPF